MEPGPTRSRALTRFACILLCLLATFAPLPITAFADQTDLQAADPAASSGHDTGHQVNVQAARLTQDETVATAAAETLRSSAYGIATFRPSAGTATGISSSSITIRIDGQSVADLDDLVSGLYLDITPLGRLFAPFVNEIAEPSADAAPAFDFAITAVDIHEIVAEAISTWANSEAPDTV